MQRFIPNWSDLRAFGNNRLLRSTYFWIVFIPIVAKFLSSVEEIAHVTIFGHEFQLTLGLPFKWTLFFYGSLITAIGNVIYAMRCPSLVKDYETYLDYKDAGKGIDQLIRDFSTVLSRFYKSIPGEHLQNHLRSFSDRFCEPPAAGSDAANSLTRALAEIPDKPWSAVLAATRLRIIADRQADAFWSIREFVDQLSPLFRGGCAICYVLGLGCFLVVLLQNIWFVIKWQWA